MRHAIESEPRDGNAVILVDIASWTYDIARWSAETGEWIRKTGEPSKIKPTHWHPMSRDPYRPKEDDGSSKPSQILANRAARQLAAAASDVVAPGSLAIAAPVTVEPFKVRKRVPRARRRFAASSTTATLIAATLLWLSMTRYADQEDNARISTTGGQVVEQETQSPNQDGRKTDLSALLPNTVAHQASVQTDAQVRQIREGSASETRQSFEEVQRLGTLVNQIAEARRVIDAPNLQLREQESELAMARPRIGDKRGDADGAAAELDGAEEPPREPVMPHVSEPRAIDPRTTFERAANSQTAQATQAVEAAASEQAAAVASHDGPEVAKLMARASALLGQGNISAARRVLERAAERGSAQANLILAKTYDPIILSKWGIYGPRGDATKARRLYAKAYAGGIREAKDRSEALDQ